MDISDVYENGVRGSKSELHQVQELHLSRGERYRILTNCTFDVANVFIYYSSMKSECVCVRMLVCLRLDSFCAARARARVRERERERECVCVCVCVCV